MITIHDKRADEVRVTDTILVQDAIASDWWVEVAVISVSWEGEDITIEIGKPLDWSGWCVGKEFTTSPSNKVRVVESVPREGKYIKVGGVE